MPHRPAAAGSGRGEDPGREPGGPVPTADPVTAAEWEAWCDSAVGEDEPPDPDEVEDPESAVAWECDLDAIVAECRRITAEEAAACARAARLGLAGGQPVGLARRGPGEPGSARRAPGEFLSRAAGFAAGMLLDTMAGCGALAGFAAEAAGEDDRFGGAGDDEVAGVIAAWDRVEAHAAARKHAAVAEFIRRRPEPGGVLAADQRITAWARELRKAGLDGDMDVLRARAYLDLLLGKDSRPGQDAAGQDAAGQDAAGQDAAGQDAAGQDSPGGAAGPGGSRPDGPGGAGPGGGGSRPGGPDEPGAPGPGGPGRPPGSGVVPAGFAGKITLTLPLATLLDLADRPAEIPGIGPIDPWLARDFARAAAANPKTTWCVTVTDEQGHAVGHGCARSVPKSHAGRRDKPDKHGPPDGRDPPQGTSGTSGPGFSFTATGQHGPPGGYGAWRLYTGVGGPRDLIVALDPVTTQDCDHRFAARGHDPGVKLRHLSQIRYATCTGPVCRRPSTQSDFEHNTPYEAGGRTCLCNGGPKCRRDHRLKQHPRWKADQLPDGTFQWTTPSGRQYTIEPTRYPI